MTASAVRLNVSSNNNVGQGTSVVQSIFTNIERIGVLGRVSLPGDGPFLWLPERHSYLF
jgi:hypothetical protein